MWIAQETAPLLLVHDVVVALIVTELNAAELFLCLSICAMCWITVWGSLSCSAVAEARQGKSLSPCADNFLRSRRLLDIECCSFSLSDLFSVVVPPVMQQFWAYLSVKQHLSHKVLLSQHFCPNLTIEIIVVLWYYVITERETNQSIRKER